MPDGMTSRDIFAAMALANATICSGFMRDHELKVCFGDRGGVTKEEIAAAQAYRYADAMLKRAKAPVT